MAAIVITGLPGTGKTRVAHAVAAALAVSHDVRLLHTDAVKHVLRMAGTLFPSGPGYDLRAADKARRMRPYLAAQAEEARAEGFVLVVEGTLAVGFEPADGLVVQLMLPEPDRLARVARKPACARMALAAEGELKPYRLLLAASRPASALIVDATREPAAIADDVLAAWAGRAMEA